MQDTSRKYPELIEEISVLRQKIEELEISEAGRKRTEESLRKSEERFRLITETIEEVFWMADADIGRMIYISPSFERIWGRSRESLYDNPRSFLDAIHVEDRERVLTDLEIQKSGQPFDHEYRIILPDGNIRYIWDRGFPVRNEQGEIYNYAGIAADMTDRKRMEMSLRTSEETARAILNASQASIVLLDHDGIVQDNNENHAKRLQSTREALLGKCIWDSFPQELSKWRKKLIETVFETGQSAHAEDERAGMWNDIVIEPIFDRQGNVNRVTVHIQDITKRKGDEERLRESEQRFRHISSITSDIIYSCESEQDGTYRINWISGAMEHITGYAADEIMDQKCWSFLVIEEDKHLFDHNVIELIPGTSASTELRLRRKDGRIIWIESNATCIQNDEEKNKHVLYGSCTDITDRKRTEEALRESEKRFRELAELLPEAVFETDIRGTLTFANKNAFDRFGYTPEDFAGGLNLLDTVPPHERGRALENTKRFMNRENIGSNEYTMQRKDGTIFPAMIHATAIIQDGKPAGLRGFAIDITESKQAEKKLRESEEKFNKAFRMSPILTAISTMEDGRFSDVNEIFLRTLLFSREEVIGKTSRELGFFANPAQRQAIKEMTEEKGYAKNIEVQMVAKNGQIIDGLFSTEPITINNEKCWLTVMIDMTEQKRAETALRESEETFRTHVENSFDVIFTLNKDGEFLFVSNAWERHFGYPVSDVIGKSFASFVNPDDVSPCAEYLMRTLNTGQGGTSPPYRVKCANGDFRWFVANGTPYIDTKGNLQFIGVGRDLTASRQAEEEKRLLEERLNRAEKMESLGTLAGGVAHDLNNVLGVIVGYAELALGDVDKSSPLKRHLETVMSGGMKAAAIVDDLLTLARRGVSGSEVINLNKIIADFQKSPEFEKLYSYHPSVKFKTDMDNDLSNISGSSVHLSKSIYNLISNAAEAMPKGGNITIKTSNQSLDKSIQGYENIRKGDYAVISVSDTGEGISDSNLKRIFEPFYTKKKMGRSGTGLGLAVVWGTVKDHHGYIDVESEVGKGTTFKLYFPVTREDIAAKAETVAISAYMGKGESILIVDDVEEQRNLAAGMLASLNYTVTSAASGEDAVAYLKEHQADLIVLDMIMDPGMDGLDTYTSILKTHPKQKTIIVSGYSESERVKTAKSIGAGAYVRKPYIKEKLGLAVRKELDRST